MNKAASKLRHPIRAIREPFGKAGLIVACLALVFAMVGGAYAAGGGLSGKQKKEVTKIAKKFAGKLGAAGPQGPQGNPGPPGAPGKDGAPGANGRSVAVSAIGPEEAGCNELGGAEVKAEGAASGTEVCNGSPWTAGGTLPSGQSEYGTFVYRGGSENGAVGASALSFPIPLESVPQGAEFLYAGQSGAHCKGSSDQPSAPAGYLCVYDAWEEQYEGSPITGQFLGIDNGEAPVGEGAGRYGALINFETNSVGVTHLPYGIAEGTWAVTEE